MLLVCWVTSDSSRLRRILAIWVISSAALTFSAARVLSCSSILLFCALSTSLWVAMAEVTKAFSSWGTGPSTLSCACNCDCPGSSAADWRSTSWIRTCT
ncbi:hypothetical protein D3C81_1893100 [compost metagenome]